MPSLEHNGLVEMFRENPSLAPHLLTIVFHADVPPHASVRVADSGLDQLIPLEFRADLVLELLDDVGKVVLAMILEVQREKAPRKKYTWPVYWAVARAERECPGVVLVVAPDAEVATWADERVDLGLGRASMQPLVLGPATVPVMTDPEVAANEVELSVLSAMAHGNGSEGPAVLRAALGALERLDREHGAVYFHIIWNVLREPMKRALEAKVMKGQAEGETKLLPWMERFIELGEAKGKAEGKAEGKQETLLRLLARLKIDLTEDERARIRGCSDPAQLDRWLDNILGARTAADVFS